MSKKGKTDKKLYTIFIPKNNFYLWIIFILVLIISIMNIRIGIPGIVLLLFLVLFNIRTYYKRQNELANYIENLNFNIDSATKDTLLNFPLPLAVIEPDGTIIWFNSSFRRIFDKDGISIKNAMDKFIEETKPSLMLEETGRKTAGISGEMEIGGSRFKVLGSFVKLEGREQNDSHILMLYFIDYTDFHILKTKYKNEKPVTGIIIIDNYDDLMQSIEDTLRPQLLAEIEKKTAQWLSQANGLLKKYERDKYLFIVEYKNLREFEEKKFEILDSIKEISIGNRIPVTLSIGIGIGNETIGRNFSQAAACIDIALGRGGDQVVISDGDSFNFYGGRTRELEKRTRVKARVIAYALRELIDQAFDIMIMGHENCDNDSLGAALGLYRIVRCRNKEANIILNNTNTGIESLKNRIEKSDEYPDLFLTNAQALDRITSRTLLIIVDTHRPTFTECPQLFEYTNQVVVIDHHRRGTEFIQDAVLSYQETYASSTCELVTELLQYVDENLRLNVIEAEALYAGIIIDTKNFTFKTGVRTFEAASFLRRQGVDTISVKQLFQNDLQTYLSISNVVRDAYIIHENIALSSCSPGTKNALLISAKAADELLSLSGIMAAFVLCQVSGEISISGRSLGDINVQVILEKLGGGGHLTNAGAQLAGISLDEAREKLKNVIQEYVSAVSKET